MKTKTIIIILTILVLLGITVFVIYRCINSGDKYTTSESRRVLPPKINRTLKSIPYIHSNSQLSSKEQQSKQQAKLDSKNSFQLNKAQYYAGEYQKSQMITMDLINRFSISKKKNNPPPFSSGLGSYNPLQEILDSLKGDESTTNALKAGAAEGEKVIGGILNAFYEEWKNPNDPEAAGNLIKAVGCGIVNVALACAGLGFLSGVLDNWLKATPPKTPTGAELVQSLESWISGFTVSNIMQTQIQNVQDSIQNVGSFIKQYEEYKNSKAYITCPSDGPCTANSSNTGCDPVIANNKIISCMLNPSGNNAPFPPYDPSGVAATSLASSKRLSLKETLLTSSDGGLTGTSSIYLLATNGITNIGNIITNIPSGYPVALSKCYSTLYPSYMFTVLYIITYYQELALFDSQYDPTSNEFPNPWMSSWIGQKTVFNQSPPGFQPPNNSNLLGTLQSIYTYPTGGVVTSSTSGFYAYIVNTFNSYFLNLVVGGLTPTYCCQNTPQFCTTSSNNLCWCQSSYNVTDNNGILSTQWYELICQKYNDYSAYQDVNSGLPGKSQCYAATGTIWGNGDSQQPDLQYSIVMGYLTYFNEYLNFPFDTYLKMAQMAGLQLNSTDPVSGSSRPTTSKDLFNNMLWSIITINGTKGVNTIYNPPAGNVPVLILIVQSADPSGGYPFGLDKPSYLQSYQMYQNPPTVLTDIETIDSYNTYCTPLINLISPGGMVDATPLQIDGDPTTYTKTMYCEDVEADTIRSCTLPGVSPGTFGNNKATQNSRIGYCYNTKTKKVSNLLATSQNGFELPSAPTSGAFRVWEINANNFIYRLMYLGDGSGDMLVRVGPKVLGITSLNWDGPSMSFNLTDGTSGYLVFGPNQSIVGGNIQLPPKPVNIVTKSIVFTTTPVPTTNGPISGSFLTPINFYDASFPATPTTGNLNKNWTLQILNSNSAHLLTLDYNNDYYLDTIKCTNVVSSDLCTQFTSQTIGSCYIIFGKGETVVDGLLAASLFSTPVQEFLTGGLPTPPPPGGSLNWAFTTNGQSMTIAMDQNQNFTEIAPGGPYTVTVQYIMGGIVVFNIAYTWSGYLCFNGTTLVGGALNGIIIDSLPITGVQVVPGHPLPPVAPYTLKTWNLIDPFSCNYPTQPNCNKINFYLDSYGNYYIQVVSLVWQLPANYTQLVQLIPPPPAVSPDGVTPYLSWDGSIMTFMSADEVITGTINFNNDTIVGCSIQVGYTQNVNYGRTNAIQS